MHGVIWMLFVRCTLDLMYRNIVARKVLVLLLMIMVTLLGIVVLDRRFRRLVMSVRLDGLLVIR